MSARLLLGTVVAPAPTPWVRWGRVVAVPHDAPPSGRRRGLVRVWLREYADEAERWPSGWVRTAFWRDGAAETWPESAYRTGWWVVPWQPHSLRPGPSERLPYRWGTW